MAWGRNIFYEFVACVCVRFCTIFLVIAFFMTIGFSISLMTVSFALPIGLYKSLWKSENWLVHKVFNLKDIKLLV